MGSRSVAQAARTMSSLNMETDAMKNGSRHQGKLMKSAALLIILALGIAGCTASTGFVKPARESHTSTAPTNRIPADVQLRISPKIRELKTVVRPSTFGGSAWSYPLVVGPALSESLSNLARSSFKSVTADSSRSGRGTVSFDLVEFRPELIGLGTGNSISVEVVTRVTIMDAAGRTVFSMVASGQGQRVAGYDLAFDADKFAKGNPIVADLEQTTQRAIEDMIQKFAVSITNNADLRKALITP